MLVAALGLKPPATDCAACVAFACAALAMSMSRRLRITSISFSAFVDGFASS
jgi:hypothetical protein